MQRGFGKKPKSHHWSFEREVTLIEFYAAHPIMWNPFATSSSMKIMQRNAEMPLLLEKLAAILDNQFTVEEIQRRFLSLRSTFRDNNNKVNGRNMPPNCPQYVPTWQHYNRLLFLEESFKPRTAVFVPDTDETTENNPHQDPLADFPPETGESRLLEEHDYTYCLSPQTVASPTSFTILRTELTNGPSVSATTAAKRISEVDSSVTTATKRNSDNVSATAATKRKMDNVSAPVSEHCNEKKSSMDMYAAFGVQVADSLRAMGPLGNLRAARVMLRVQELLVKYHPDNTDNTTD